jgi:hypothetical protein
MSGTQIRIGLLQSRNSIQLTSAFFVIKFKYYRIILILIKSNVNSNALKNKMAFYFMADYVQGEKIKN